VPALTSFDGENKARSCGVRMGHARKCAQYKFLGYNASKAGVNMVTVRLAAELVDTGIKVNSADPGFTATDLNSHRGSQTVPEGAAEAIRLALLAEERWTGGFFSARCEEPW
jgi:NAD(P)-dependent dehydrogenase (short-subunit alcohol dehydrogenase family)